MSPWREWVYGGPNKDGRFTDTSFVYVLKAPNNLCKIGRSKEPVWRIRRHRQEFDGPLELICLIRHPRAAELEKRLHYYFTSLGRESVGLEWFRLTDGDVRWLRDHTTEEVDCCDGEYCATAMKPL